MVVLFCSSCSVSSLATPAFPKILVHHSLQGLLHICHTELHLPLLKMSPELSFNATLKPQELKYKFVLLLE